MKRMIALSLAMCTAAVCFASCGKTGKTDKTTTSSAPAEETQPTTVRPTERVRDIEEAGDFEYEILDGGAVITKYTGSDTDIVIPDQLEGCPVTSVGYYAFEAHYDITSVLLPETVKVISEGAFMDCSSLSQINLPDGLTNIERGAFVACVSLGDITLPASVVRVEEEAFTACEGISVLTILSPTLEYENWGLEDLPELMVSAPEGSPMEEWAIANNKLV